MERLNNRPTPPLSFPRLSHEKMRENEADSLLGILQSQRDSPSGKSALSMYIPSNMDIRNGLI